MVEYKDLVWEMHGFRAEKDDIFYEEDSEEVFLEGATLEEAVKNIFIKCSVWTNKYNDNTIFEDETEALDDAMDRCEDEKELEFLQKRMDEIDGIDEEEDELSY